MVQMFVYRVGIDPAGQALVILTDEATEQFLPIWIGPYEAHAIAAEIEEKEFERPLTHDLLCTIIGSLDSRVAQVAVTKLTDQTFYAEVTLEKNGQAVLVDSRPSDAIALALKTGAAIFVAEEVLARAGLPSTEENEEELEQFKELMDRAKIDPDFFNKRFRVPPGEAEEETESN